MPYHLQLQFDPDRRPEDLKPAQREDGSVNHYELGYVQNVVQEQLLARLQEVDATEAAKLDSRFVLSEKTLPAGPNTAPNPDDPTQLLAKANGYACFENGLVTVKKVLRIPGNVDFSTGNLLFVGDLLVERSVLSGFKVQARNILVKGHIGGAEVTALESLVAESGVKGERQAVISAGQNLRIPFCEHATLLAKDNIIINGVCMHSRLFVGRQLAVKGKFMGGAVYCRGIVYVQEQLGSASGVDTELLLGYDPFLLHKAETLESHVEEQEDEINQMKRQVEKFAGLEPEMQPLILAAEKRLHALLSQKIRIWELIRERESTHKCGVVVPGKVLPGVLVRIGDASLYVERPMENVRFYLQGDTVQTSSPAMSAK